jgi:FeS assembly SUF system protein
MSETTSTPQEDFTEEKVKALQEKIINMLKTVYDPEIPVDVFELGLIYEIKIDEDFNVKIEMTLTSPNCPVAESMPAEIKEKVGLVHGVSSVDLEVVFDPPWSQEFMSEEAKLELGFL